MEKRFFRLSVILLLLVALAAAPGPQAAHAVSARCYVDAGRTPPGNGAAWESAYTSLQSALTNLTCGEIWVADGVYKPGPAGVASAFIIPAGLRVYGGFAGGETLLGQRLPSANVAVLSGDLDSNDVNDDGNFIAESSAQIVGGNTDRVVRLNGSVTEVTTSTVLDGFTITAGYGGMGAGLSCDGAAVNSVCSPTLTNLIFSGNHSMSTGGAMYNDARNGGTSSPVLTNVRFSGNSAQSNGGGLANEAGFGGTASPTLTDVVFSDNTCGVNGGGVYNSSYSLGFANSTYSGVLFEGNTAGWGGGAVFNLAAGGYASPMFVNSTFSGNSTGVAGAGGAVYNMAESEYSVVRPEFRNVTFNGNSADVGGAMSNATLPGGLCAPILTNVILWGDTVRSSHAELWNTYAEPVLLYSVIPGGCAGSDGGLCGPGILDDDPRLGALADNGGATQTMALLAGSSAIDTGDDATCAAAPVSGVDQRGVTRPQGAGCDIGAFEAEFSPEPVADFDGDRDTDLSVFRPSTGVWYIKNQVNTTWGTTADVPVPGDYDGDGDADVAIWRPSTGIWYIKNVFNSAWGSAGDVPVPGDYDGDGDMDVAIWRPSDGKWYVKNQSATVWGASGDIPVQKDYDGDGDTDLAVFRPSTGVWYIKGIVNTTWGTSTDMTVPGDYNADGTADVAIFRPSTGIWYIKGLFNSSWGSSTDIPVPGDYDRDGDTDVAIWRPSNGTWYVKSQFSTAWGSLGDFPLPAPDTNGDGDPYQ